MCFVPYQPCLFLLQSLFCVCPGFETADMAPRLTKAAADSKAAVDRASESLRARRMAIESAKLETLIETLGACVRTSLQH